MPLLLRIIAQRVAIFALGFLAFLGINPDVKVPTTQELQAQEIKQKEIVQEILSPNEAPASDKKQEQTKKIENQIKVVAEEITKKQEKTQEVVEKAINIPQIENTNTGISVKTNFIDDVIVNIVCVNRNKNLISMTTGSGVIISSTGLVITNSHVANAFLFNDEQLSSFKECSIRRENIPTYGYNAELVYLPSDWLSDNKTFFTQSNPRGSGEDDYAILAITSNTNPVLGLPGVFNHAELVSNENDIKEDSEILIAAYPGIGSGVFEVDSKSKLRTSKSYIKDLITFKGNTIDVVSTGPNEVAKRGSSGGGVFLEDKLLGIVTTTDQNSSGTYINALTSTYILRDFKKDTGENLNRFISYDKNYLINSFKDEQEEKLKSIIAEFF